MRRMVTTLIFLVCAVPVLRAEDKTPADQLKDIRTEWSKAQQDWVAEYQNAKPEDRPKLIQNQPKPDKFVDRALELAEKNTKDADVALEALVFVVQMDRGAKGNKAIKLLTKDYAESDKIKPAVVLGMAQQTSDEAADFLKAVAEKNKDTSLKGVATFAQGQMLRAKVQMLDRFQQFPAYAKSMETQMGKEAFEKFTKQKPEDLNKEAEKLFVVVTEKYKDVEIPWGRGTAKIAKKAEGQLFEMRNLAVGKTAPDEAFETLEGKKVKLSDYRGKVVVLDIWATWCGPCVAMIPHERDMVKKLSDKPFNLISISADAKKETLEDFLKKTEMPWTHVHNGQQGGLVEKWNVSYFPTIYVIDAKGVIRHKDIRDKQLEEAVEKLIKEAEEASKKSS